MESEKDGPGFSSTWPESMIKNRAEPKSNLGGLGCLETRLGQGLREGLIPGKLREFRKKFTCITGLSKRNGGGANKISCSLYNCSRKEISGG